MGEDSSEMERKIYESIEALGKKAHELIRTRPYFTNLGKSILSILDSFEPMLRPLEIIRKDSLDDDGVLNAEDYDICLGKVRLALTTFYDVISAAAIEKARGYNEEIRGYREEIERIRVSQLQK